MFGDAPKTQVGVPTGLGTKKCEKERHFKYGKNRWNKHFIQIKYKINFYFAL